MVVTTRRSTTGTTATAPPSASASSTAPASSNYIVGTSTRPIRLVRIQPSTSVSASAAATTAISQSRKQSPPNKNSTRTNTRSTSTCTKQRGPVKGGRGANNNSNQRRKVAPQVLTCPQTGRMIYHRIATVQEIHDSYRLYKKNKNKEATSNNSPLYLYTIPSSTKRQQIYWEASMALQQIEQQMLPQYGNRSWQVQVKIHDNQISSITTSAISTSTTSSTTTTATATHKKKNKNHTPFFVFYHGHYEIATWPYVLEKIPLPPRFPGYKTTRTTTKNNNGIKQKKKKNKKGDDDEEEEDDQDYNETTMSTEQYERIQDLMYREHHLLSDMAYYEKWRIPLPIISIKWISPLHQIFYTRKSAYEHAKQLCIQEISMDRLLYGYNANGIQSIQPTLLYSFFQQYQQQRHYPKNNNYNNNMIMATTTTRKKQSSSSPSKAMILKVGKLRFERDGIWIVGQECQWERLYYSDLLQQLQQEEEHPVMAKEGEDDDHEPGAIIVDQIVVGTNPFHTSTTTCSAITTTSTTTTATTTNVDMKPMTGLAYYIHSNRIIHRDQRRKELYAQYEFQQKNHHHVIQAVQRQQNPNDSSTSSSWSSSCDRRMKTTAATYVTGCVIVDPITGKEDLYPMQNKVLQPTTITTTNHPNDSSITSTRFNDENPLSNNSNNKNSSSSNNEDPACHLVSQSIIPTTTSTVPRTTNHQEMNDESIKDDDEARQNHLQQQDQSVMGDSNVTDCVVVDMPMNTTNNLSSFAMVPTVAAADVSPSSTATTTTTTSNSSRASPIAEISQSSPTSVMIQNDTMTKTTSTATTTNNNSSATTNKTETGYISNSTKKPSFTLLDADRELRAIWKTLTAEQQSIWRERAIQASIMVATTTTMNDCNNNNTVNTLQFSSSSSPLVSKLPTILDTTNNNGMIVVSNNTHASVARGCITPSTDSESSNNNDNNNKSDGSTLTVTGLGKLLPAVSPASNSVITSHNNNDNNCHRTINWDFCVDGPSRHWCLDENQIQLCYDASLEHFEQIMKTVQSRDLLRELHDGFDLLRERGRGRYDMELPQFDTPEFAFLTDSKKAPWMPVVRQILGKEVVLIHKGVFLSLPGAELQEYHQDGIHLSTQHQRPCHAINVFVPLVDLTTQGTEFCLGSHILGCEDYKREFLETPRVGAGTPIIFDYRLGHRGLGNSSSTPRPVVYCTYAAAGEGKEFRDSVNFSRKRYHRIGDLISKTPSREERAKKRQRLLDDDPVKEG